MPTSLDSIVATTRQRLSQRRAENVSGNGHSADREAMERSAAEHTPRGFRRQLLQARHDSIAIIAELKKASPSKGLIRDDFRPAELARELELAGAACLSVLTDEPFFQGSLDYLRAASSHTSLPCLRKDFIIDEFQIVEARANRADAILLIVAALTQKELITLAGVTRTYELDVLCEAHDNEELQRALDAGCDLIGVNNRNLKTFEVDFNTALQLATRMPDSCVKVAESGIHSGQDLARLRDAGYQAFLIGESLMKEKSPGEALTKLLEEAKTKVSSE